MGYSALSKVREFFLKQGVSPARIEVNGFPVSFYVSKSSQTQRVLFLPGKMPKDYILILPDSIKEQYRMLIAYSEYRRHVHVLSRAQALKFELDLVPREEMPQYLEDRLELFNVESSFMQNDRGVPQSDREDIQQCTRRLGEMLAAYANRKV